MRDKIEDLRPHKITAEEWFGVKDESEVAPIDEAEEVYQDWLRQRFAESCLCLNCDNAVKCEHTEDKHQTYKGCSNCSN